MKPVILYRKSFLKRDILFKISTDVTNFQNIMPNHFKSLTVLNGNSSQKIILEKISFLGLTLNVITKHIFLFPDIHDVYILSGPLKGTSFNEKYNSSVDGTAIVISITLKINGVLKFIPFFDRFLIKRMSSVMNEFIFCAENYSRNA